MRNVKSGHLLCHLLTILTLGTQKWREKCSRLGQRKRILVYFPHFSPSWFFWTNTFQGKKINSCSYKYRMAVFVLIKLSRCETQVNHIVNVTCSTVFLSKSFTDWCEFKSAAGLWEVISTISVRKTGKLLSMQVRWLY